jgi:exopolysaccharide production protein ExoZ
LLLLLPVQCRLPSIVAAGAVACAVHGAFGAFNPFLAFYTDPIVLEFVAGTLIGALLAKARGEHGASAPAVLVLGIALLVALPEIGVDLPRVVMRGAPAAIIVGAAVLAERRYRPKARPFAKLLGDASYSIYLVHTIVLAALGQVWMRFGVQTPMLQIMFFVLAILMATAVGLLVHAVIERPLLRATRAVIGGAPQDLARPGPQRSAG